jgi:anthranilate phosphoribosyltransferase
MTPDAPHPFSRFVAILGRGKSLTRSLTIEEADEAMRMILAGETRPEQIGAFLMLLRMKEETGEEIAGFIRAARACFAKPADAPRVDLDWPSYAGKKRQLPWHLLAAVALARSGWSVFMHGLDGHTHGRVWTGETLQRLGFPLAGDFEEAAGHLRRRRFAYMPLARMSPKLAEMMELKPILGLRSPVHTLARGLDPFAASTSLQAVFHPRYVAIHRDAAIALREKRTLVFRGEGGENERRPNKPCETLLIVDGICEETRWPATFEPRRAPHETMNLDRLEAVWRGAEADEYGDAAIVGTMALALWAMGVEGDPARAEARAEALWRGRDRSPLAAAA